MKKITITLIDPEDDAIHAHVFPHRARMALERVASEIFRPHRKHGYPDKRLENLSEETHEAISVLEELFWNILKEEGAEL